MENEITKKGSFSNEIKDQLLSCDIKSECCKNSFICGSTVFVGHRKNRYTETVQRYCEELRSKKRRKRFFDDQSESGYVSVTENGVTYPVPSKRVCQSCAQHLMRGAFIVCGRASKGNSGLHLEAVMPNEKCAELIVKLLSDASISPKQTVRRGEHLIYYKRSESIQDFLAYIGAVTASFELMNDTIFKEIRLSANRQKNCDTTNIIRAVDAANRQTEAIRAIIAHGDLEKLSPQLRETAQIRLDNPIEPLEVITELHESGISRSGVNHRLNKIVEIAIKKGYLT